ncbi:MAG TPA: hypothetical protein VF364_09265 [Candidatus Limnocylindria bacterium]
MKVFQRGISTHGSKAHGPSGLALLATDESPMYMWAPLSTLDADGLPVNGRIAELTAVNGPHRVAEYYEERDLRDGLLACAYHFAQLALLYVERVDAFARQADPRTLRGNTHDLRAYFEISAFLTKARTWYDSLFELLWARLTGDDLKKPDGFTRFLHCAGFDRLESTYADHLAAHWAGAGRIMNQYRNAVAHSRPVHDGGTNWFEPVGGGLFGVTVRLPSNPGDPRPQFDFEHGPDALDFCHATLLDLIALGERTTAIPEIRARLDQPRRLK